MGRGGKESGTWDGRVLYLEWGDGFMAVPARTYKWYNVTMCLFISYAPRKAIKKEDNPISSQWVNQRSLTLAFFREV